MSVVLGFQPIDIVVTLAADSDFLTKFFAQDGWPVGTQIELRFTNSTGPVVVWEATVSGTDAVFSEDVASVAALIAAGPLSVRLHYLDTSGDDLLWGKGRVSIV